MVERDHRSTIDRGKFARPTKIRLNVQDFLDPSRLGYFKKVGECQEFASRYVFNELAIFLLREYIFLGVFCVARDGRNI